MRTYICLIVFACATVTAQNPNLDPSSEITIKATIHEVKYCLGPTSRFPTVNQPGKSEITLWLTVDLAYENHGQRTLIVPLRHFTRVEMSLEGKKEVQTIKAHEKVLDLEAITRDLDRPEAPYFVVIPPGASEWRDLGEFVSVRVRGTETSMLGRTLRFEFSRDHGLISQSLNERLQARWKALGTLWVGARDAGSVTLAVPESPVTEDCTKNERF